MFSELVPLINDRTSILLTISPLVGSDRLRVCVIPKPIELKDLSIGFDEDAKRAERQLKSAVESLNESLYIDGTPEELDASFVSTLKSFSESAILLHTDIEQVVDTLEAGKKALDGAKKSKTFVKNSKAVTTAAAAQTSSDTLKTATEKQTRREASSLGLFDQPNDAAEMPVAVSANDVTAETKDDEEE